MDAIAKRLTARHLAAPDPAAWLVAADRLEELGGADAALWRRRGQLYRAVREQFDDVLRRSLDDPSLWRTYGVWEVRMLRYPQTVRVWAGHSTRPAGPGARVRVIINVNVTRPAYFVGRLLGLIDRLDA